MFVEIRKAERRWRGRQSRTFTGPEGETLWTEKAAGNQEEIERLSCCEELDWGPLDNYLPPPVSPGYPLISVRGA